MDDEPFVDIDPAPAAWRGTRGTTPLTFTVTLSAAYDVPVTVDYDDRGPHVRTRTTGTA